MKIYLHTESMVELDVDISINFIIQRIRSYVASQGWSRTRIAREAGLPHHTSLRNFDSTDWNPSVEISRQLEVIVPKDFFLAAPEAAV
jgi:hypothetical protein